MRTTIALGLGAALALTGLVMSVSGRAATAGCKEGMTTFGGTPARVFCGQAKATVHARGKTFTIRGGNCLATAGSLTLDIGEVVIGRTAKPKPEYVGVTVGRETVGVGPAARRDGVYRSGVVAVVHAHRGYALRGNATVTLTHHRTRGTFAATSLDGGRVTGSFTC